MVKKLGSSNSMMKSVTMGSTVSVVVTMIIVAVFAALISTETITPAWADYCALAALLLSATLGSVTAVRSATEKQLYMSLAVGGVYLIVLLAMTALLFGGQYRGVGVSAFVVFSGAILAVLIGQRRGKRSKSRRSKIRRR